jgi:hypothetical protein
MGELYGSLNHGLIEPMYEFDRFLFNYLERGLQFLYKTRRIQSDLWLNWEKFILWGDPFREEFTVGNVTTVALIETNKHRLCLPLQTIVSHKGGQIDDSDLPIENLLNTAPGFSWFYFPGGTINELSVFVFSPFFLDYSGEKLLQYQEGFGIYPGVGLKTNSIHFLLAYWNAYRFIGLRGEPLFYSTSVYDPGYSQSRREILTASLGTGKKYPNGITIAARVQAFYDVIHETLEHNAGVYMLFDRNFFLRTVKP